MQVTTSLDTGLGPKLTALARARGADAGRRHLTGQHVTCPWPLNGDSLTRSRMAREWLDAFHQVSPLPDVE